LLSVKNSSPRVLFCSRRRNSSPRVFFFAENIFFTLAKEVFAESLRLSSHRRILLSVKTRFPVVFDGTFGFDSCIMFRSDAVQLVRFGFLACLLLIYMTNKITLSKHRFFVLSSHLKVCKYPKYYRHFPLLLCNMSVSSKFRCVTTAPLIC
jgi:hypothetical protein